jgi:hypothetical protein
LRAQSGQCRLARVVEQRSSLDQPLFQRHAVSPKVAVSFEGVGECLKVRIHGGSRELHRNAFPLPRAVCVRVTRLTMRRWNEPWRSSTTSGLMGATACARPTYAPTIATAAESSLIPIPEKGRGEGKQRDATEIPPSRAQNDPRPYWHVGADKKGHQYVKRR